MTGAARECCGTDSKDKGDTNNGCAEASIHVRLPIRVRRLMLPRCEQDFKCGSLIAVSASGASTWPSREAVCL
jgi:hypothetical protein